MAAAFLTGVPVIIVLLHPCVLLTHTFTHSIQAHGDESTHTCVCTHAHCWFGLKMYANYVCAFTGCGAAKRARFHQILVQILLLCTQVMVRPKVQEFNEVVDFDADELRKVFHVSMGVAHAML